MGEVIRRDAAAADILADANATLTNAVARGGTWQTSAEARLGPVIALSASVEARRKAALTEHAPVHARLNAGNDVADNLVGRISDDIWNLLGRPGNDPALDILFPGGVSYYTDGDVTEQPGRMLLLAELLESGIHPRLDASRANGFATELRASASALQAHVDASQPIRLRLHLTEKMHFATAKAAHAALVNLKRAWKSDGQSEVEIHTVIPDRPGARKTPQTPV